MANGWNVRRSIRAVAALVTGIAAGAAGAALLHTATGVGKVAAAPANGQQRAQDILAEMGKRIGGSKTLTVQATREMDAELARQTGMPEKASIEVAVMRPNRLRARSVAANDSRVFLADGSRVTVHDEKMNVYASVAAPGSIDQMLRVIEDRFGFAPPLGEVLSNDPHGAIRARTKSMSYGGEQAVDGQRCHKLLLRGERADAELFVSATDQLPRRLLVTFKDTPGSPRMRMSFSEWRLDAPVDESRFTFFPPKGANQVEMVPSEKLDEPPGTKAAPPTPATPPAPSPSPAEPQPNGDRNKNGNKEGGKIQ